MLSCQNLSIYRPNIEKKYPQSVETVGRLICPHEFVRNIALEVGSPEVLKVSFPWRSQVSDNLISQTNARPTRLSSLLPVMVSNSNH